ncbi:unnamed protein product, partial [Linum tenue]
PVFSRLRFDISRHCSRTEKLPPHSFSLPLRSSISYVTSSTTVKSPLKLYLFSALMEAQRKNTIRSSSRRRKPLSDRSNTLVPVGSSASCSSTSSSSYLLKKPLKSFPSSSQLLHSRDNPNPTETHLDKVPSTAGSTTSAVLGPSTSTPARPQRNQSSTVGGDDVWEPSPVYVRRKSGSKRKDKEKAIDVPAIKSQSSSGKSLYSWKVDIMERKRCGDEFRKFISGFLFPVEQWAV